MGLSPAGRARRYVPALRRRLLFRLATSDTYERLVRALPPIATAARRRALHYVAGETLDDALAVARTLHARGLRAAIDFFGEQVRHAAEAERAVDGYLALARRLPEAPPTASVALDLSHVGQDISAEFCLRQLEHRRCATGRPRAGRGRRRQRPYRRQPPDPRRARPAPRTRASQVAGEPPPQRGRLAAPGGGGARHPARQGRVRRVGATVPSLRAGHGRCLPPARPLAPRSGGTRDAGYPRRGASRRLARRAGPDGRGDAARGPTRGPRAAARARRDAPTLCAVRARLVSLLDAAGSGVAGRRLSHHARPRAGDSPKCAPPRASETNGGARDRLTRRAPAPAGSRGVTTVDRCAAGTLVSKSQHLALY